MTNNSQIIVTETRKVQRGDFRKIPFVEIYQNRLQGVVSSGSSGERVYVCVIDANTDTITCHTNNNRPCGGLRGGACSHIKKMHASASSSLDLNQGDFSYYKSIDKQARYPNVFSRYINYIRYLNLELNGSSFPEMSLFLSNGQSGLLDAKNKVLLSDQIKEVNDFNLKFTGLFSTGYDAI